MNRQTVTDAAVFAGLVALGAGSRLIGAEANFAAVGACALFAGVYFRRLGVAAAVPTAAMLLSDGLLGGYDPRQMAVVYSALALPVLFRTMLGRRPGAAGVLGASVLSALAFFLITNFAVWAFGHGYSKDAAGLALCYARGLEFLRPTLLSQLVYGLPLFALHRVALTLADRRRTPLAA